MSGDRGIEGYMDGAPRRHLPSCYGARELPPSTVCWCSSTVARSLGSTPCTHAAPRTQRAMQLPHDSRRSSPSDDRIIPDPIASTLLRRATELDATLGDGTTVAQLREAAAEAGITNTAFDAALAELNDAPTLVRSDGPRVPSRRRYLALAVGGAAMLLGVVFALSQSSASSGAPFAIGASMIDETIPLRCLSPSDAAELVRPLLPLRENGILIRAEAPHTIRVRGTATQVERVRAEIERHEPVLGASCATRSSADPAR